MGIREDEKRWKRIHDALAADASGKTLRPVVSQRTLFGIPSSVETQIEQVVAQDEAARKAAREKARHKAAPTETETAQSESALSQ